MMSILHHHIQWPYLVNDIKSESITLRPLNTWTHNTEWGEDWLRLFYKSFDNCDIQAPNFENEVYFSSWTHKQENVKMWKKFSKLDNSEAGQGDYQGVRIGVDEGKLKDVLESKFRTLYPNCEEDGLENYIGLFNLKRIEYHSRVTIFEQLREILNSDNSACWSDPKCLLSTDVMNLPCQYGYQGEVRMYIYYDRSVFEKGIEVPVGNFNDFVSDVCFDPRMDSIIKGKRIETLKSLGIDEEKIIDSRISLDKFQTK